MEAFFSSGNIALLIIGVLVVEVILLALWRLRSARPMQVSTLLLPVLPGLFLLLALRAALTGQSWPSVGLWLGASFPAHLADLWLRHTKKRRPRGMRGNLKQVLPSEIEPI